MTAPKKWTIAAAIVVLAFGAGYFAFTRVLDHYVRDGKLAELIGKKTAAKLGADAGYLPLSARGLSVRSDGLLIRGKPPRALTLLQAANLAAFCSAKNLWHREWTITRLQASHAQVAFGSAAAARLENILSHEPQLQPQIETSSPVNLEIRETVIARTDLFWGETADAVGYIKDVETRFYPKHRDLDVFGRNGIFGQTGWPELKLVDCRLFYAKPKLTVRSASLSLGQKQNINVAGEFDFGEEGGMRLHVSSIEAPADPFLKGFWKGKFESVISSENDLEKKSKAQEKLNAHGEIRFARARIHDVPALKQIAVVTRHPQFEAPKIETLQMRYNWNGSRLEVTEFVSESKDLFRIEGAFSLEKEEIDGHFRIGVAPGVASSIPGAREKVFTEERDGMVWTKMTLSGPTSHPREDLKERLVAAAKEHFAKGLLAPLFKPGKPVIEMLNAIYQ